MASTPLTGTGFSTMNAPRSAGAMRFGAASGPRNSSGADEPVVCKSGEAGDILDIMPELGKYGAADLEASFQAISRRNAKYYDRLLLSFLPPEQRKGRPGRLSMATRKAAFAECMTLAAEYGKRGRMGILEESADMLFEQYSVVALRKKFITHDQVHAWAERLNELRDDGQPFFTMLHEISSELDPAKVRQFSEMTGIPEKRAQEMLGLMGIKFAQFQARDAAFDPLSDSRPRVVSEAKELVENLPRGLGRYKILAQSILHANLPGLPPQALRKAALNLVNKRLGPSVDYDMLMQYVFIKQLGRQELDFENPELTYNQRKAILKLLETLLETHLLKDAAIPGLDPKCLPTPPKPICFGGSLNVSA